MRPSPPEKRRKVVRVRRRSGRKRVLAYLLLVVSVSATGWLILNRPDPVGELEPPSLTTLGWNSRPLPLVMQGGDPYIRALMRTISASEANDPQPYSILYGGQHVPTLNVHPDRCVKIISGPNAGDCTTAAGRYQLLTSTWLEKAYLYHSEPSHFLLWDSYSFEPKYQDEVVYDWLNDPEAWGTDLSELLRQGELDQVLQLLSGTWTSLGYGIESNLMTEFLPKVYDEMLEEELQTASKGE